MEEDEHCIEVHDRRGKVMSTVCVLPKGDIEKYEITYEDRYGDIARVKTTTELRELLIDDGAPLSERNIVMNKVGKILRPLGESEREGRFGPIGGRKREKI